MRCANVDDERLTDMHRHFRVTHRGTQQPPVSSLRDVAVETRTHRYACFRFKRVISTSQQIRYMEIIKFINFNKTFHIAWLVRQAACRAMLLGFVAVVLLNCMIVINFVRKARMVPCNACA